MFCQFAVKNMIDVISLIMTSLHCIETWYTVKSPLRQQTHESMLISCLTQHICHFITRPCISILGTKDEPLRQSDYTPFSKRGVVLLAEWLKLCISNVLLSEKMQINLLLSAVS
jgi:hypothetical protein